MKFFVKLGLSAIMTLLVFGYSGKTEAASVDETLIKYSKQLIGTPYVYGGMTINGFDCSGFMQFVFKQAGITLPRTTTDQFNSGTAIAKKDLQPGDIVFFNTSGSGVSHSGMYIGGNQFIHADSTRGIMISSLNDPYYWKARYIGAKRYINTEPKAPPVDQENFFNGLEIRNGQIGVIEVNKPINLWQRDNENNLQMVRVLQPGEKYRVYSYDSMYGGQYGLGGTFITNMKEHITYSPM